MSLPRKRTVELIERDGGTAIAQQFDASDEASIKALMKRAIDEFGGIDGVHANAMDMSTQTLGVDGEHDLLTLPLDVWQRTIDVGLTGFLLCARHSIPSMLERGGGSVVATVSGAVYVGEPIRLAYADHEDRHDRHGPTHRLAVGTRGDPGQRGRAWNGAGPGEARRGRRRRRASACCGWRDRTGSAPPMTSPAMVTFLMSDDGSWVTGQVIAVDGGVSMRP